MFKTERGAAPERDNTEPLGPKDSATAQKRTGFGPETHIAR